MSILFCGGEDVDFPAGGLPFNSTDANYYRTGYARCAQYQTDPELDVRSDPFLGGAVTSCWLSARVAVSNFNSTDNNLRKLIGLAKSGTNAMLLVGSELNINGLTPRKVGLYTWDGTTLTELAISLGPYIANFNTKYRLNMQVTNYGATANVKVWWDDALIIDFTGDTRVLGNTSLDQLVFFGTHNFYTTYFSEFIVADEDTRAFPGLVTLALTGAGTTDDWTGVYSTINPVTYSDDNPNYTNTVNLDQQFNITNLPAGTYDIKAIRIAARAAKSTSPTPTKISLGYNDGGTVGVGTALSLTTGYATKEQIDHTNPVTGLPWVAADINALQLDMRSIA